jgi:hypothetical protein
MMQYLPLFFPCFILWGFVLYGLVYLFVSSDLLERQRKWFTDAIPASPEDAAIEALLAGDQESVVLTPAAGLSGDQAEAIVLTPTEGAVTQKMPTVECLAQKMPETPADAIFCKKEPPSQSAVEQKIPEGNVLTSGDAIFSQKIPSAENTPDTIFSQKIPLRRRARIFYGKVLSCERCCAGHVAVPSAACVIGLVAALQYNVWWLATIFALVMIPPTGIGLTAMLDIFSPKRASESVVNAMTDIAQVVLMQQAAAQKPKKGKG